MSEPCMTCCQRLAPGLCARCADPSAYTPVAPPATPEQRAIAAGLRWDRGGGQLRDFYGVLVGQVHSPNHGEPHGYIAVFDGRLGSPLDRRAAQTAVLAAWAERQDREAGNG